MPPKMIDAAKNSWIERFLGMTPATAAKPPALSPALAQAACRPAVWDGRPVGSALSAAPDGQGPAATPGMPAGTSRSYRNAKGRMVEIVTGSDGRVAFKSDRPPLREITFSGGGGKGIALPGAAQALAASGALDEVKVFRGASVGSMTAAVLAAGITADKLTELSGKSMMPIVTGGDIVPVNLSGETLETFVRDNIRDAVAARIKGLDETLARQVPPGILDPAVQKIRDKTDRKEAVTFGDLRTLSAFIPAVKEVVISATMMGDNSATGGAIEKNGKTQLAIFSADTEPDMDVALAVHASAALPPVFKPVDLKLSSGVTARFEDGGVMNNAPTSGSVGAERQVDPLPPAGNMTFVFEGKDAQAAMKGEATPEASRFGDWLSKASYGSTLYATALSLADRPEDIVTVPLKFKGKWNERTDFTGTIGGLVNFSVRKSARDTLQAMTKDQTAAFLAKRKEPETHEFASAEQMYCCIGRDDLAALATDDAEAAKVLAFRDEVVKQVRALEQLAATAKPEALDAAAGKALDAIDRLADAGPAGAVDRLAFLGRELNRSGKLDPFLTRAKAKAAEASPAVQAGIVVADTLATKSRAQFVLREVIYPKLMTEGTKGAGGTVLLQVDKMLRAANSPADLDKAVTIAIDHFKTKSDITGRHHHRQFAEELAPYLMR